jgi:hypothetical protein
MNGGTAQQQMEDIFRNITNRQQQQQQQTEGGSSSIEMNSNHPSSQSDLISAFRDYNHNIGEFIYYNKL